MFFKQLVLGVGGGTLLSAIALFLTTPREVVEDALCHVQDDCGFLQEEESLDLSQAGQIAPEPASSRRAPEGREVISVAGLEGTPLSASPPPSRGEIDFESFVEEDFAEPEELEEELPLLEQSPEVLSPDAHLGALSKQTIVRARPEPKAPILGFVRTGTLLRRALVPAGTRGCKGGWYKVEPRGYVCAGVAATLDEEHPILALASFSPDRSLAMPYVYGRSRLPTPTLYTRVPTNKEQQQAEQDLVPHTRKNFGHLWEDLANSPAPGLMLPGEKVPRPYGYPTLEHDFMTGRALVNSSFAFIDLFEEGDRYWGLTADLNVVPLDRVTPIEASDFFGRVLGPASAAGGSAQTKLPIAFVRKNGEQVFTGDPEAGTLKPKRGIEYRESFALSGREVKVGGTVFLETSSGQYIRKHQRLVRIELPAKLPKWAAHGKTWIDVSIQQQRLIVYQGEEPVFATLVSTGKDGLGEPEETHSTVRGIFRIHTKHVTATMSGDESDDEFDLRDIPYVQYFEGGYAFHAAYWHDGFGTPRSHGCVNLSPSDARYLFNLTDPPVPAQWHSALSLKGTLVYIHP